MRKTVATCAALAVCAAAGTSHGEGTPALSITSEQVQRGAGVYAEFCLDCHGANLSDGQFGAPIKGSFFRDRWAGKPVSELMTLMSESMPPEDPGYLYPEEYADVLAYILAENGIAAGGTELPEDPEALKAIELNW